MGSTNGNITSSTVLVVEVESEPEIATAFLRQNDVFLPGESTLTAAQVTNTGNTALDIDWDLVAATASGANPCTGSLVAAMSGNLAPGAIEEIEMIIDVDEDVDSSASCSFTLTASHSIEGSVEILDVLDFTVNVDEAVNFLSLVRSQPSTSCPRLAEITKSASRTTGATMQPSSSTLRARPASPPCSSVLRACSFRRVRLAPGP